MFRCEMGAVRRCRRSPCPRQVGATRAAPAACPARGPPGPCQVLAHLDAHLAAGDAQPGGVGEERVPVRDDSHVAGHGSHAVAAVPFGEAQRASRIFEALAQARWRRGVLSCKRAPARPPARYGARAGQTTPARSATAPATKFSSSRAWCDTPPPASTCHQSSSLSSRASGDCCTRGCAPYPSQAFAVGTTRAWPCAAQASSAGLCV